MLYIHQTSSVSPQKDLDSPNGPVDNLLIAREPLNTGIPANILRRMSKSVKMAIGAAQPLLPHAPDGILVGTGYGGMEESIRFLNQVVGYDEGILTPGPFVQSTANAIAAQLGLLHHNNGYNITFVNRGLAFESALLDAAMLVREHPGKNWLVGGVDEISTHNYRLEFAEGWYKKEDLTGKDLYGSDSPGSIAGEGASLFLVSDRRQGAIARITGIVLPAGEKEDVLRSAVIDQAAPDCLISGENGDCRTTHWYRTVESMMGPDTGILRFKHLCGEYPTASAFGLWLACNLPANLPPHLVRRPPANTPRRILLYNQYKFFQHSLILLEILR